MKNSKLVVAAFAALSLTAGQAMAQEEGGEGEGMGGDPCAGGEMHEGDSTAAANEPMAGDGAVDAAPALITPKGKIAIHVGIGIGLSKDLAGKPIDITPDIFYGVAPKLEVGLAHSGHALTGFWADSVPLGIVGTGVCVTGTDGGCAKVYNGPVGILGRYSLVQGSIDLAADAGVIIGSLDPFQVGVKLGVRGRKVSGKMSIGFAPNIYVGLSDRDAGNKESLAIPVDLYFGVNEKLGVGLQTGIEGPLDGFGDSFVVPVTVGGIYSINDAMSAGLTFNLHRVTGGSVEGVDGPGAADLRSLGLMFGWHN